MSSKGKYIGLNQRIPFEVLDSTIQSYIEYGNVDRNEIVRRMLEFTTGQNRANKAAQYVNQILNRQMPLLDKLKLELKEMPYYELRIEDRKALCLCLTSLTYPITYDLLIALAQGF